MPEIRTRKHSSSRVHGWDSSGLCRFANILLVFLPRNYKPLRRTRLSGIPFSASPTHHVAARVTERHGRLSSSVMYGSPKERILFSSSPTNVAARVTERHGRFSSSVMYGSPKERILRASSPTTLLLPVLAALLVLWSANMESVSGQETEPRFTIQPNTLYLGQDRLYEKVVMTCLHPAGVTGASMQLKIDRNDTEASPTEYSWLATVTGAGTPPTLNFALATGGVVSGDYTNLTVTFAQADCTKDKYVYRCGSTVGGVLSFKTGRISTKVIPRAKVDWVPKSQTTMRPGVRFTINCQFAGKRRLNVTWNAIEYQTFKAIQPGTFSMTTTNNELTRCVYTTTSILQVTAEEVTRVLSMCKVVFQCKPDPHEYTDVAGGTSHEFTLDSPDCENPIAVPSVPVTTTALYNVTTPRVTPRPRKNKAKQEDDSLILFAILGGLAGLLLLVALVLGVLAVRKRGQQKAAKAEMIRRLSVIRDRQASLIPPVLELQLMRGNLANEAESSYAESSSVASESSYAESEVDNDAASKASTRYSKASKASTKTDDSNPDIWIKTAAQVM